MNSPVRKKSILLKYVRFNRAVNRERIVHKGRAAVRARPRWTDGDPRLGGGEQLSTAHARHGAGTASHVPRQLPCRAFTWGRAILYPPASATGTHRVSTVLGRLTRGGRHCTSNVRSGSGSSHSDRLGRREAMPVGQDFRVIQEKRSHHSGLGWSMPCL